MTKDARISSSQRVSKLPTCGPCEELTCGTDLDLDCHGDGDPSTMLARHHKPAHMAFICRRHSLASLPRFTQPWRGPASCPQGQRSYVQHQRAHLVMVSAAAPADVVLQAAAQGAGGSLLPVSGPWGVWAALVGAGALGLWAEKTKVRNEPCVTPYSQASPLIAPHTSFLPLD